jgi:hypothetical protein
MGLTAFYKSSRISDYFDKSGLKINIKYPENTKYNCSRHGFTYIRGWMQMVLAPKDLFSWNNNTMSYILIMDMLHYCCPMHNDTYSVHNRSLKPWWSRLPCFRSFCYVFSPPLSGFNWRLTSPFGGPGPPTPKMASPLRDPCKLPFQGPEQQFVLNCKPVQKY